MLCLRRQHLTSRQGPGLYLAQVREHEPGFVLTEVKFALDLAQARQLLADETRLGTSSPHGPSGTAANPPPISGC